MIGIQKALGFKKSEITKRYVLYSVFAVIIGIISGILLGYFVIERLINNAYYNFYVFPNISAFFNISDILIISAIEFVIVILAALIACRKLLARSAVSLIRGNDFSNVKNHAYEKTGFFKRSSLYTQTTVNNLANDKTRVIATLVGIVGCTALVVMAMTLLQTLGKTPVKHFSDVALYDQNVYCDNRVDNAMENVKKTLSDNNVSYLTAYQSILFIEDDEEVQHPATVVVPESKTDFTKFFNLTDESTGDALHLTGNGVIISYTYAKYFDTKVGDTIRLMTTDGKYYDVRVSGICQYYLSCYQIFMSRDYYKSIVSEPCDSNSALVNLDGTNSKELLSSLQKTDGFFSMNDDYANWVGIFNKMVSAINIAGYVALLLSFTMAMLVLLNLNVMFIGEKSRELIIMRVNGFGLSDTKKYIYRDNIILTILGIILGIALGIMLGLLVLVMMQLEGNHFYITPSLKACVIGIITSTLFAIITNLIALRKIGKLKLSDLSRV